MGPNLFNMAISSLHSNFLYYCVIFIPMTNWDCPTGTVPFPSVLLPTTAMVCGPSERALTLIGGMPGMSKRDREYVATCVCNTVRQMQSLQFQNLISYNYVRRIRSKRWGFDLQS